jgi:hypothetical protein
MVYTKRRKQVSESSFSFTTKINGADLFTVRGNTYDEYLNNLTQAYHIPGVKVVLDMLNGEGMSVPEAVAALEQTFGATVISTPAATVVATPTPTVGGGRTCVHGAMSARQGTGKDGKIWRGYMCNAPKGATDKCKNIYIYPSMPEWHTFVAS